jgi:hypothetical protein
MVNTLPAQRFGPLQNRLLQTGNEPARRLKSRFETITALY